MEASAERLAYAVLLSRDRLKPDVLMVVGVDRRSANFGKTVDRLDMP
jgi:56kDa selenium binding protein (SBP56)